VIAYPHHGVEPVCRVLQVAPSAVRSALARPVCARRLADEVLKPLIQTIFDANYRVYGRRKIKAALAREHGLIVDKDRISRLMGELGIRGAVRSKTTITTRSDRSSPRAPDLVNRQFRAERPNELWCATSRTCRHGRGSCTRRSSSTCSAGASSAGAPPRR
jgi:transposase InsO family protein